MSMRPRPRPPPIEPCIKGSHEKWIPFLEKHSFSEKNVYYLKNFKYSRVKQLCAQVFPLGFNRPMSLNVNQRNEELRWLARVGMFSQNKSLHKHFRYHAWKSKSLVTHLFVKIPQPGNSEVTFSVCEPSC